MALVKMVEYADASPDVKTVDDEIMRARSSDWINNFCPANLRRMWDNVRHQSGRQYT